MKRSLLLLFIAIAAFSFQGCKKDSFDPTSIPQEAFIGTWKGSISTFKNNQLLKQDGTVVFYPDATSGMLSGILFMDETSVFHEFQFVNGTMYFNVENNNPTDPFCQNWSLGGFAVFAAAGEMDIHITGNECGQLGDEFVNWRGTLTASVVPADSIQYFNFAKNGNSWTYKTYLKNGDSCQLQKQVSQVAAGDLFKGTSSQTCGWPGQNIIFSWKVSPSVFSIQYDSTLSVNPVTFPINAQTGVVYRTFQNKDTIAVILVDTNLAILTTAGSFRCVKYKYTEPVYVNAVKINRTSYLWLDNRFGIVRQEVANPIDSTDVQLQVLSAKNF
jgi:hypothetical protein